MFDDNCEHIVHNVRTGNLWGSLFVRTCCHFKEALGTSWSFFGSNNDGGCLVW